MQGRELLPLFPSPNEFDSPTLPASPHQEEFETSAWTLPTPPLRYEVASMQHWLDLNA